MGVAAVLRMVSTRTGGYRMPGGGDVVQIYLLWVKVWGCSGLFSLNVSDVLIEDLIGFRAVTATV